MPLHAKNSVRDQLVDDVYCSRDGSVAVPKYRFPLHSHPAEHAYAVVHDELMLDGNARMNLATFCQTWVEPEVHRLMDECLDKNIVDKDEYPQTAEIEARSVHMLADLWNSPAAANTIGCSTTGSSEAAMLAGLALKWQWRERRRAARQVDRAAQPDLRAGPGLLAQIRPLLRRRAARGADGPGRYLLTPEEVLRRVDENTIGVVATLGVTFTCQYEPVREICQALDDLAARTDLDVPVHVDAASGGFIAPFLEPDLPVGFPAAAGQVDQRLGAQVWAGALGLRLGHLARGRRLARGLDLSRRLSRRRYADVRPEFFPAGRTGDVPILQLLAVRPRRLSQGPASLPRDGGVFWPNRSVSCGPFEIVHDGRSGLPAACWTLKPGDHVGNFTLYDLADRLRYYGWQVCAYPLPGLPRGRRAAGVDPARRQPRLDCALVADIRRSLDWFREHPISVPVSAKDGSGFHH